MPAWTEILNSQIDQDSPVTQPLLQALRDNPAALLEGDPSAPVNFWAWHPYDKVTNGDTAQGQVWGFTANGAVSAVVLPDFEEGWDYKVIFQRLAQTTGASTSTHSLQIWRNLLGNYDTTNGAIPLGSNLGAVGAFPWMSGVCYLQNPRRAGRFTSFSDDTMSMTISSTGLISYSSAGFMNNAADDYVVRARITNPNGGNVSGDAQSFIWLHRRRSVSR
jgi:hypothetical protein